MAKTKEELDELKKEYEELKAKLEELDEDELKAVAGGDLPRKNEDEKYVM